MSRDSKARQATSNSNIRRRFCSKLIWIKSKEISKKKKKLDLNSLNLIIEVNSLNLNIEAQILDLLLLFQTSKIISKIRKDYNCIFYFIGIKI